MAETSNGPPKEVSPSELWIRLTELPRPFKLVDFPRKDPITKQPVGKVAIWVLTQGELMIAQAAADEFAKKTLKENPKTSEQNLGYEELYKNAAAVEIICRACRRPDDLKQPAFPSPKLVRSTMLSDEVAILARHYLQWQAESGPIIAYMSEADMDAWLERLSAGGSKFPLALLSSGMQEDLLMHSARRLYPSLTAKSLSGSPPSEPSSESDPAEQAPATEGPDEDEFAGK